MILLKIFPLLILGSTVNTECPTVVSKLEWGGRSNKEVTYLELPINYVIIEHTATQECDSLSDCTDKIYNIQHYQMNTLDYHDIGYNFLIGNDGNVYEGTGWNRVGAHTHGWNTKSLGIAFVGDFSNKLPSPAALEAAKKLLECGVDDEKLKPQYKLLGHRQLIATASPGITLFREITKWTHFAQDP